MTCECECNEKEPPGCIASILWLILAAVLVFAASMAGNWTAYLQDRIECLEQDKVLEVDGFWDYAGDEPCS